MATATETGTDVEVIKALDFEPRLPCEAGSPDGKVICGLPAEWVSRCKRCGFSFLICDPHRLKLIAQSADRNTLIVCGRCGARSQHLEDLAEFVPIGRGR